MKVLELFSGTHSVGKVCKEKGWSVVSVDIDGRADINIDILEWNYKEMFEEGEFDIVWASPPCNTFSHCRRSWIGRKLNKFGDEVVTAEMLDNDMIENGLPLLRKTEEIIDYFKPKYWFIENPKSSKMKDYLTHRNNYIVDYCKYSDWGYQKSTRIWTNNMNFKPLTCKKDCGYVINGKHKVELSDVAGQNKKRIDLRYRIPHKLIESLFDSCEI